MTELAAPVGPASDPASAATPDPSGTPHPPAADRHRAVFAVTALGAFLASLDLSIVNVAFPAIEEAFPGTSRAALAWVITGYTVVFGSLLVAGGRTADRLGRRRVFFGGLAAFTLGSALCGLAPSVSLLIAGRVLQGVGAAFTLPASLGLLLAAYPAERRSQAVAMWGGVGALAVATGPSLGAVLIEYAGWRSAFYVNVPVALVAWLVGRRVLPDLRPEPTAGRPDLAGALLLTTSLAALVLALSQGSEWGLLDRRTLGCALGSVVLLAGFLRRSARHPDPLLDLGLFQVPSFALANAATLVYAMGFFALLLGNILFLTGVWGWTILEAGLAVVPGPLVVAVVAGPAGRLAARVGFRPVLVAGGATLTASLGWYLLRIDTTPDLWGAWLPGTLLTGLGVGLTFPVLSAAAVAGLPPHRFAVGGAVNQTARQIGGSIGVAVLVALLGPPAAAAVALPRFQHLWVFVASTSALTAVLALALAPPPAARRS